MKKLLEIFLSVLTAVGGFVEIGELTFAQSAGAQFGYHMLWVVVVGTIGIMVYGEMAGRIAAVTEQPVFHAIRLRSGIAMGLLTLVAANVVSLMTCAAEVGGMAIILRLLFGGSYRVLIVVAVLFLFLSTWVLPFKWIERLFGLMGLLMGMFVLSAIATHPDWSGVARGSIPHIPSFETSQKGVLYFYFVVSFMSSIMLPYEMYFYASGGIEDRWKPADVAINRTIVIIGFALGGFVAAALVMNGAQLYQPHHIDPQLPGTATFGPLQTFGATGLRLALIGMFFAFAGAGIETAFSAAYGTAQFFGWPWGKYRKPAGAPRFTLGWVAMFVASGLIMLAGVDPVALVEYAIVFSVVILPFSYFSVLRTASDRRHMGPFANGPIARVLGWFYLALITVAGLAAIPLLIATHGGKG